MVVDALVGMAQCAVTPAGKLDKSQEELGDEAAVEEKFFSCIAADADHAVLIWTGLDSFGGREDQVCFWQEGWCRVLAKVRWSVSCCAAARAPPGLERRVIALPNEGDKRCATMKEATLETPKECLSFPRHRRWSERTWWSLDRTPALRIEFPIGLSSSVLLILTYPRAIIDVDASGTEGTHWRDSSLSRPVLFACQVQRRTVQSVRCRSCVQSVCACARARHVNNLIQQDAECSHEVERKLFRLRCLHGLVLQEILVVDTAAIEQIRSSRTKTRCLSARIRTLALPTNAKQKV